MLNLNLKLFRARHAINSENSKDIIFFSPDISMFVDQTLMKSVRQDFFTYLTMLKHHKDDSLVIDFWLKDSFDSIMTCIEKIFVSHGFEVTKKQMFISGSSNTAILNFDEIRNEITVLVESIMTAALDDRYFSITKNFGTSFVRIFRKNGLFCVKVTNKNKIIGRTELKSVINKLYDVADILNQRRRDPAVTSFKFFYFYKRNAFEVISRIMNEITEWKKK
jgi:hypothetical protein